MIKQDKMVGKQVGGTENINVRQMIGPPQSFAPIINMKEDGYVALSQVLILLLLP